MFLNIFKSFHLDSLHLGSFLLTPQSPHLVCDDHHCHIQYDEKDNHSNALIHFNEEDEAPSPRKIHLMGVFPQDPGTATPSHSSCGYTGDNCTLMEDIGIWLNMTGGRLDWWDKENLWKFKGVNWEAGGGGLDRELDLVTVWRRQDVDTWVLGQLPHPGIVNVFDHDDVHVDDDDDVVVAQWGLPGCWASCPTPGGLWPRQRHPYLKHLQKHLCFKTPALKDLQATGQPVNYTKAIVAKLD